MSVRGQALLFLVCLVAIVLLSQEGYRYFAFRPERAAIRAVRPELIEAGAAVARAEARIDTLQTEFAKIDAEIQKWRTQLDAIQPVHSGMYVTEAYEQMSVAYEEYNRHVRDHNELLGKYQRRRAELDSVRRQYYFLADSARSLAARMGDPYYAVPTVAQAAQERGVQRP